MLNAIFPHRKYRKNIEELLDKDENIPILKGEELSNYLKNLGHKIRDRKIELPGGDFITQYSLYGGVICGSLLGYFLIYDNSLIPPQSEASRIVTSILGGIVFGVMGVIGSYIFLEGGDSKCPFEERTIKNFMKKKYNLKVEFNLTPGGFGW